MMIEQPINEFSCHVCGRPELDEVGDYGSLPRVTSDCKPFPPEGRLAVCAVCGAVQKPADRRWLAEISDIYQTYDIYFQSSGVEQAVFDPANGVPNLRSRALLTRVEEAKPIADQGSLIDIGCGRGAFLSAFANFRPRWNLYGHELSLRDADSLLRITAFRQLFSGPLKVLPRTFDIVSLIHSLEHFDDPLQGLRELREKLTDDGCLIVEVPNAAATAFDLVVADHASHFSASDLARLFHQAGLEPIVVADHWITKELSAVGRCGSVGDVSIPAGAAAHARKKVQAQVDWLRAVLNEARRVADAAGGRFGIFGTSIAAMWLFGELGD